MKLQDPQSGAATVSYFDGQRIGRPLATFIVLVTLGIFFEQFDLACFGYTAPAITKFWGLSMAWVGSTNAIGSLGMLAGAFLGGWFADKVGRKLGFLVATTLYGVATILCGRAPTPSLFVAARFVTMMGASALTVTAMVFIAEMVPAEKRGKLGLRAVGLGMCSMPLAGFFAKWVVALGPEGWRLQYYWGGVFALVEVVLVSFLCYESPRWLVSVGKGPKAKDILERMLPHVTVDLPTLAAAAYQRQGRTLLVTLKAFNNMWSPFYRRRSILLMLLAMVSSSTVATTGLMLPTLFKARGLSIADSILTSGCDGVGNPGRNNSCFVLLRQRGQEDPPGIVRNVLCGPACDTWVRHGIRANNVCWGAFTIGPGDVLLFGSNLHRGIFRNESSQHRDGLYHRLGQARLGDLASEHCRPVQRFGLLRAPRHDGRVHFCSNDRRADVRAQHEQAVVGRYRCRKATRLNTRE